MARYRLHQKSYLRSAEDMVEMLHDEGAEIDMPIECPPGPHWEPLDDDARAAVKHFADHPELLRPRNIIDLPIVTFNQAPKSDKASKVVPVSPEAQNRKSAR
jgi:hypothetical protein